MTDAQKANELPECTTEGGATTEEQDMSLRQETTPTSSPTCEEPISSPDKQPAPSLLSMPCLLDELHRDSAAGQPQETDPPLAANQSCAREDSDSSVCQRSPSSSGNLGDSDSSAEEAPAPVQTAGRKSRRSHSESDTPSVTMAAKKNRCHQKQVNGRVRVRAPRSQQQKQRMRQLRQKREAAVRRKPDVLQDSSTSDSDITAHSSSSSPLTASSDNDGERVNSHAPGAVPAVEVQPSQVSLASTDSEVEIVGVQENAGVVSRFPHGGVIQSLSSWKQRAPAQWTSVSAQSVWVPPPEVVDLTLDEDRHRYLL
ncbi:protein ARK2N-like isoform X3 [Carassius carassius]|uniref:protein ARK2N-like isoform X3 n=1 Tax=Carassius carassius TaxID=217509 RepID=UPI002868CCB9|nr:protein ARK2N-like isoform X3 [Carassius carassius]